MALFRSGGSDINGPGSSFARIPGMLLGFLVALCMFWFFDYDFSPEEQMYMTVPLIGGLVLSAVPFGNITKISTSWLLFWNAITMFVLGFMFTEVSIYIPFFLIILAQIALVWLAIPYSLNSLVTQVTISYFGLNIFSDPKDRLAIFPFIPISVLVLKFFWNVDHEIWQTFKFIIAAVLIFFAFLADSKSLTKATPKGISGVLFEVMSYCFFAGYFTHSYLISSCDTFYWSEYFWCIWDNVKFAEHFYMYFGAVFVLIYCRTSMKSAINHLTRNIDGLL